MLLLGSVALEPMLLGLEFRKLLIFPILRLQGAGFSSCPAAPGTQLLLGFSTPMTGYFRCLFRSSSCVPLHPLEACDGSLRPPTALE